MVFKFKKYIYHRWEFRTNGHDIKFGVSRELEATGEKNTEIELTRVASHQLDEEGFMSCIPGWTYTVLFDNSYSYFTSKRLRYAISMSSSSNVDELAEAADAMEVLAH